MTLTAYIRNTAAAMPQKEALVFEGERLSYTDLEHGSNRMARFLSRLDIKKGDRIGILMPNCIENVLLFLAVLKAGCIEVNLSPDMPTGTIIRAFKQTEISVLICGKLPVQKLQAIIDACPEIRHIILERRLFDGIGRPGFMTLEDMNREHPDPFPAVSTDTDLALIQFTSGTTGAPKGVALSQKSFIAATRARQQALGLDEKASILNILRLSHSCSKSLLFDALVPGATMVLAKGFVPPSAFLKTLREEKITMITGPPFLFHQLLKLKNRADVVNRLRSSLKYLEIGLAGAPSALFHDLREAFPWITIINRYGVTENAGAAGLRILGPEDSLAKAGTFGIVSAGGSIQMSVSGQISASGRDTAQTDGVSEIRIKGEAVMIGYWEDLKKGRFQDYQRSGFDTGDLVETDSDGHLYIVGRKDDTIQVAGERIAPKAIEDVILQLPGIREVAVFGIEDGILGQKIGTCYYAKGGNRDEEIQQHCRRHLPPYMVPYMLAACNQALPKNAAGKISRRVLRKRYQRDILAADPL